MRKMITALHFLYKELLSVLESPHGALWFFRLLKKNPSTHYIILDQYIGDSLAGLVYLRAYRRQMGYDHITVVAPPYIRVLCDAYGEDMDEVCYLSKRQLYNLEMFAKTFWGQKLLSEEGRRRITFVHWTCYLPHRCVDGNPRLTLKRCVKELIYQLDDDAEMKKPHFPQQDLRGFIEKYDLKQGKTVLLNPYANTVKEDVFALFSQIANELRNMGYAVKTITANAQQQPVPNTEAIPCSLVEAFGLSEYCGHLIGLRSGFMDLMLFSDCAIVSIESPSFLEAPFFRLEGWEVNERCHSIRYDGEDPKTLAEVMEAITG